MLLQWNILFCFIIIIIFNIIKYYYLFIIIINAKYWVEFKASSMLGTCIIEVSCMPKPQKDPYVPGGLLSVIV